MIKNVKIYRYLERIALIQRQYISQEEQERFSALRDEDLPEGVLTDTTPYGEKVYYRYPLMTEQEINTWLAIYNAENIRTIKNSAVFLSGLMAMTLFIVIVSGSAH
ncbi:hypothetical protein IZU99_06705 [Oscillospiraceae bacterium CM]|nr:hypothetical protein IZU99_06705 [Oscillospiraceae bacterium CM]